MEPTLAAVVLTSWRFLILVGFSATALIVSFYCLLFMVREKNFWARIHSLGGGLRGIEAHVAGVKEELSGRLEALQKATSEATEALRQEAQASAEKLAKAERENARETDRLRRELQGLQVELREAIAGNSRLNQTVETLSNQLQQLRGDLDGLGVELRESVRQQVADSFLSVESTILAALDAVQEEMLYGSAQPSGGGTPFVARRPGPKPGPSGGDGERQNIISMGPLFAGVSAPRDAAAPAEDEAEGEEAPEAAEAKAAQTEEPDAADEDHAP
jgi:hypothetical protein